METINKVSSQSDEEEDLEALRLAALQTLQKKKAPSGSEIAQWTQLRDKPFFNSSPKGKNKRGKFFGRVNGTRGGRNTNNWARNSNLIAVPMISNEKDIENDIKINKDEPPKLILPQDRYCKTKVKSDNDDEPSSKFDRYDNSDDTDSEDDDKNEEIEDEKGDDKKTTSILPAEIKRSNSLDALMEELENEIQGDKKETNTEEKLTETVVQSEPIVIAKKKKTKKIINPKESEKKENLKPKVFQRRNKWVARNRPFNNQTYLTTPQDYFVYNNVPTYETTYPTQPQQQQQQQQQHHQHLPPLLPQPSAYNVGVDILPPPVIHPPPPLIINTDLSTNHLPVGQLSPRSAAFVMQNRAIIEKRKKRSYSRSPSPPSPPSPRFRRSKSPKRFSPSPLSSKRRSLTPERRNNRKSPSPSLSPPLVNNKIHERLGHNKTNNENNSENNKKIDPILEARRKKFESNEITIKEGVIKLKKNDEVKEKDKKIEETFNEEIVENKKKQTTKDDIDEEIENALLEGDDELDLDLKMDLFSDEESDSDNEGRFKTKQKQSTTNKVPVLPFSKLLNGTKTDIKMDINKINNKKETTSSINNKKSEKRNNEKRTKDDTKPRIKKKPIPVERKIEIKIRNPSKYDIAEEEKKIDTSSRKVEIGCKREDEKEESEDKHKNEGDLRAQLSRKRAERQKTSSVNNGAPSTRLLQDALEGAVFKKAKLNKKDNKNKDGKLPIHLRLGVAKRTKKQV